MGIDESKQKILLRQFRSTFHTDSINDYKTEEQFKITNIELPIKKIEKNKRKFFLKIVREMIF